MTAGLALELEILEPVLVSNPFQLLSLHPTQIRWIHFRLTADEEDGEGECLTFESKADNTRLALRTLVTLAQQVQPDGTNVTVWYQGRSESFDI